MKKSDPAAFLMEWVHPLKPEIMEVRHIILASHKQLNEEIKSNAPSFNVGGEERISIQVKGDKSFRLVFHCGLKIKARKIRERVSAESQKHLQWIGEDRACLQFSDMIEVLEKKKLLEQMVPEWIRLTN